MSQPPGTFEARQIADIKTASKERVVVCEDHAAAAQDQHCQKIKIKGRHNSENTAHVKSADADFSISVLLNTQQFGDQKSANHKEKLNPSIAEHGGQSKDDILDQ